MPRLTNRGDTIRVRRPSGARYGHADGEIYAGFGKYAAATSACIEVTVRQALYNFYREFREQPQGDYIFEVTVTGTSISATVVELDVREAPEEVKDGVG
jgi:hypothetical protein